MTTPPRHDPPPSAPVPDAANDRSIIPLSRFRAALARARHRRRADVILEDPDAARLVPSLPVQELYYAIREVGLHDAVDLLALATPQQMQGFLDLDAWDRDHLDAAKITPWIEVLLDLGPAKLARHIDALDPEVPALYLQRHAHVYDLGQDEIPEEPEGHFYPTPDTFYLLDILDDGPVGKHIERFVDWLYRADMDIARKVVMAARWEQSGELEEYAYRWRTGRMADLGYVDYYEALAVYNWLDPASVSVGEDTAEPFSRNVSELPPGLTAAMPENSFLARALATINEADALERIWTALLLLINRVMAADLVEPGDLEAAKAALDRATAYLGLGAEYLGRGDPARAGEALRSVAIGRIFRVGVSLTLKLKRAADTLVERAWVTVTPGRTTLLDPPLDDVITALRRTRPLLARVLVDGPTAHGERPFATLAEVATAARAVEEAAHLSTALRHGFGVEPRHLAPDAPIMIQGCTPPRELLGFRTLVATMAANALLDRPPLLVPLAPADLPTLRTRALESESLRPSARATVTRAFTERFAERDYTPFPTAFPTYDEWLARWLAHLEEQLRLAANVPAHRLDGLLLRANPTH